MHHLPVITTIYDLISGYYSPDASLRQSFQGMRVNVSALPFPPYWDAVEQRDDNGTTVTHYSGTDYLMLHTISKALNFSIFVLPTSNWQEVTDLVEKRVSFIATVIYAVFPQRLQHYDYSYMFEFASSAFSMAKPGLIPRWQSLYYPLTDHVWLSILLVFLLAPLPFLLIRLLGGETTNPSHLGMGAISFEVFGLLVGQSVTSTLSGGSARRLLVAAWIIFAFIMGTAYRSNLTAFLTAPKYPQRVETLAQLVRSGARVTMPPYGAQYREFFKESDSTDFKTLSERVDIVPTTSEGLKQAITHKQATIEARRFLELKIAKEFTRADGSSQLYVARESIFPGLSGWPIPHDAPYKTVLDRCIMAVKESGLYEKWSRDVLSEARKMSQTREREMTQQHQTPGVTLADEASTTLKALTIVHMQGPLLLLVLGLVIASFVFFCEFLTAWYIVLRM
ncbi:ionotropic receptor 21a-like [Cherax quadricarinatus]|uniref:ionotropic receptor 21a-like n=1 Tax=Cherax quadricarinatus TaxID=27406 RepID=UPI00387E9230